MVADIKRTGRVETDVLKYMGGLALELIAQGGFGRKVGVLEHSEDLNTLDGAMKRLSYGYSLCSRGLVAERRFLTARLVASCSGSSPCFPH